MNHGSLFTGIGGFDLAAQWLGWNNVFQTENDYFCTRVLKHHFPNTIRYEDISATDFRQHRGEIDILSGGFPCQPFSYAGKRAAKEDPRFLWAEMYRAIREIKPRWIVAENVAGLLTAEEGMVFEGILLDLEAEGYAIQSLLLPAAAVQAPHRRNRLFIIAHAHYSGEGYYSRESCRKKHELRRKAQRDVSRTSRSSAIAADTDNGHKIQDKKVQTGRNAFSPSSKKSSTHAPKYGWDSSSHTGEIRRTSEEIRGKGNNAAERPTDNGSAYCDRFEAFPSEPPICGGNDGLSQKLDAISFPSWRRQSLKAYGNAVVPVLIKEIFECIAEMDAHSSY